MFADLCFAIVVQDFLLKQDAELNMSDPMSSHFFTHNRGNRLILQLNMHKEKVNGTDKGYFTSISTERNDFGLFEVTWICMGANPTGSSVLHRGTHYVNNIQEYYQLFDRYGPPSRNRAS